MGNQYSEEFHKILDLINRITNADDLRWLARHMAIEAGDHPNIRGIKFHNYRISELVEQVVRLADGFEEDDLRALAKLLNMLYEALRPKRDNSRGIVELKTVIKKYPDIDWDTGLPVIDDNGEIVTTEFAYTYAYVRVHGNKGDTTRRRHKLLSLYADRGMGRGGSGGYVAAALHEGLVTEDQILDAFHNKSVSYESFIQTCETLLHKKVPASASLLSSPSAASAQVATDLSKSKTPPKSVSGIGYQFKIELLGIKPTIWRRFRVPGNISFADLHMIVQCVMGWESYHLYKFTIDYTNFTDQPLGPDDEYASERISKYMDEPGLEFYYEYDFGDQWPHVIILEKILKSSPANPKCSTGKRACPPEDSGGVDIYGQYLQAKKNRRIPRWLKERIGHPFDTEAFDLAEINEELTEFWQENQKPKPQNIE